MVPARFVGRSLIAGACVAALAAIVALIQGDFGDTHGNVVATSLSFWVASATAGVGDALRARTLRGWRAVVGVGTIIASAAAFLLFVAGLWIDDGEAVWRGCGIAALLALCGSHASLVLQARRRADTPLISALVTASVVTASFDTLVGAAAIAGTVDEVSDGFARLVAVVLVVMLLTTVLPPPLRRVGGIPPSAPPDAFGRLPTSQIPPLTLERLADEVAAVAERLGALDVSPAVQREAQALRDLVARASTRDA